MTKATYILRVPRHMSALMRAYFVERLRWAVEHDEIVRVVVYGA